MSRVFWVGYFWGDAVQILVIMFLDGFVGFYCDSSDSYL